MRLLSAGGRLTLIKSVLESLGIYFMSIFKVPVGVAKNLETLRARFFWGAADGEKKISWVKWGVVLNSKENGGLGVGSIQALNKALLYKWKWRFGINHNALWCKVIKACHGNDGGVGSRHGHGRGTGVWKGIITIIDSLHDKGCWRILV